MSSVQNRNLRSDQIILKTKAPFHPCGSQQLVKSSAVDPFSSAWVYRLLMVACKMILNGSKSFKSCHISVITKGMF